MYGWGRFVCQNCGNVFTGYAVAGRTSPCFRCSNMVRVKRCPKDPLKVILYDVMFCYIHSHVGRYFWRAVTYFSCYNVAPCCHARACLVCGMSNIGTITWPKSSCRLCRLYLSASFIPPAWRLLQFSISNVMWRRWKRSIVWLGLCSLTGDIVKAKLVLTCIGCGTPQ